MEADWEVEIGANAPVIEASWPGFVDLRISPQKAIDLPESLSLPGLAAALPRLNAHASPVWTTKCDVWPVAEFDPDELDAPREIAQHALACYIDLLPRKSTQWANPNEAIDWCRELCARLHDVCLHACRVDLILRRATIVGCDSALGITAYLTACGMDAGAAESRLGSALETFAETIASPRSPFAADATLQCKSAGE